MGKNLKRPQKRRAFFDWRYVAYESRRANRLGLLLFGSVVMTLFFQHFVIRVGIVSERSMLPTLPQGNYFLINKYIYRFVPPQRGEIAVLRRTRYDSDQYVKRIIALPGETLSIAAGKVYIDGQLLAEPYAVGYTAPDLPPTRIQARHCFVLGDNRTESIDSRHFGTVPFENLEGKIQPGKWFPFR